MALRPRRSTPAWWSAVRPQHCCWARRRGISVPRAARPDRPYGGAGKRAAPATASTGTMGLWISPTTCRCRYRAASRGGTGSAGGRRWTSSTRCASAGGAGSRRSSRPTTSCVAGARRADRARTRRESSAPEGLRAARELRESDRRRARRGHRRRAGDDARWRRSTAGCRRRRGHETMSPGPTGARSCSRRRRRSGRARDRPARTRRRADARHATSASGRGSARRTHAARASTTARRPPRGRGARCAAAATSRRPAVTAIGRVRRDASVGYASQRMRWTWGWASASRCTVRCPAR